MVRIRERKAKIHHRRQRPARLKPGLSGGKAALQQPAGAGDLLQLRIVLAKLAGFAVADIGCGGVKRLMLLQGSHRIWGEGRAYGREVLLEN